MQPIHPLSVPANFSQFRRAACRPRSSRKFRRRRKARRRCRLSKEEREELIKQFSRPALGFVIRWGVRDPQPVADAAMNETLRVYRKRKGKFSPLLFIILRWRTISAYRKQCRNTIVTVAIVEEMDIPIEGANPTTNHEELKPALRKAWAGLEPLERRLLHLHIIKGRTFPEIRKLKYFRAQGWTVVTLRSKAHRARLKLRAQLEAFRGGAADGNPLETFAFSRTEPTPHATHSPQTADAS